MMQLGLSARDRRTLIVGGSLVGTLFVLARGVPLLSRWQSFQIAEASTLTSDLAAARAGARLMPALRDSLRARRARLVTLDSSILSGVTAASAAASLASALQHIADESSVKISAMQLDADSASSGALVRVGVRVTATADVYGLLSLMRAIEGGPQLLAVRELAVTQPEPAAAATKTESLRLDMIVVGLARITVETR